MKAAEQAQLWQTKPKQSTRSSERLSEIAGQQSAKAIGEDQQVY
jgi:hypothetical protein